MRSLRIVTLLLTLLVCGIGTMSAQVPTGFVRDTYVSGLNQPTTIIFDPNGVMYVSEKGGTVQIVDGGVIRPTPLLDISEEVGNWRDHGLASIALDPNYLTNGYIYLLYAVDRHYLMNYGTPSYDANQDEYYDATIGRITRYTINNPSTPASATVDYGSRLVLVGETVSSGFPILFGTHGVGALLFGTDATLLATAGDGASTVEDYGGPLTASYSVQALADGIISTKEDIGVFRPQLLSCLSGKMIRIDPATGEGLPSNPFYDALNPKSAESRVWALGLRNPYSVTLKPNSGSHYPSDGEPGIFYVGDVGLTRWEEMNIIKSPGQNFGWPIYEGMNTTVDYNGRFATTDVENLDAAISGGCGQSYYYFNQLLADDEPGVTPSWDDPCNPGNDIDDTQYNLFVHSKPAFCWIHEDFDTSLPVGNTYYTDTYAMASIDGEEYNMSDGSIPISGGIDWKGNCSIAGLWYTGTDFPEEYQNLYFHGDHNSAWMRVFSFDLSENPDSVGDFGADDQMGFVTSMAEAGDGNGFYYVAYDVNTVYHVYYSPTGNQPPTAVLTSDVYYSATTSLTVNFDGSGSTDPENAALTYDWDYGDGNVGSGVTPSHTFNAINTDDTVFTVTLTVTDTGGVARSASMKIYLNNEPPVISATSLDAMLTYPLYQVTNVPLSATVSDPDHAANELTYRWQTILYHEDHNHPEPYDYNETTTTLFDPVGCDDHFYQYQVSLRVSDPTGLSTTVVKSVDPDCDTPVAQEDFGTYIDGGIEYISIFSNDLALDGFDSLSVVFSTPPSHGSAVWDNVNKQVVYTHDGLGVSNDTVWYTFEDLDGDVSNISRIILVEDSAPTITILAPTNGGTVLGSDVKVEYQISGKDVDVDNLIIQVDGGTPVVDDALLGFYNLEYVTEGTHTLTLTLRDASDTNLPYAVSSASITFDVSCEGDRGTLLQEYWTAVPGGDVVDLVSSPNYPDNPTSFNFITGAGSDNSNTTDDGFRIRGFIHCIETGDYQFAVRGRASYEFYVSTDDDPLNSVLACYVDSANMQPNENPDNASFATNWPTAVSGLIPLVEDEKYYIELILKAGQIDGFFQMEWTKPGATISHLRTFREFRTGLISPWIICETAPSSFPVELLNFDARVVDETVQIDWATASEIDNHYFTVQRSKDGEQFEDVSQVFSEGNSSEIKNYQVIDNQPIKGRSYYRLEQVDLDGTTTYSQTIEVSLANQRFLVYPNPGSAAAGFEIEVFGNQNETYQVQLLNMLGQPVFQKEVEGNINGNRVHVEGNLLSRGHYLLYISNETERWTEKIILN